MAAPKGHKKWGGRKKGTPNKYTSNISGDLKALGFDFTVEMARLYPNLPDDLQVKFLSELLPYMYSKRVPEGDKDVDPTQDPLAHLSDEEVNKLACKKSSKDWAEE